MEINTLTPIKVVYDELYLPSNLRITSRTTKNHYECTIRRLRKFLGREPVLSDLSDATCIRFMRWYLEQYEVEPQTVNQRMQHVKALWSWCARERFVEKWPNFHKLPESKPLPRAWTIDQIKALFRACRSTSGFVTCIPAGEWWLNLHRFAWESGERIGGILNAHWEDFAVDRCMIEIPAKYRKGKVKGMMYFLSEELTADLVAMRPGDEPLLFPWFADDDTFYNHLTNILKRAGLPTDRRSKMHRMRRSFASHLEANGGNATDAMKHSSRKITDDSYLDESIVNRTPAYKLLPSLTDDGEVQDA